MRLKLAFSLRRTWSTAFVACCSFRRVLHHVEAVEDDFLDRIRNRAKRRRVVSAAHVHGDDIDCIEVLVTQAFPVLVEHGARVPVADPRDGFRIEVADDREELRAATRRFLIDADLHRRVPRSRLPRLPTRNRSSLNRPRFVPTDVEDARGAGDVRGEQHVDGKALEHQRELRLLLCPRQLHASNAVLFAIHPRCLRV